MLKSSTNSTSRLSTITSMATNAYHDGDLNKARVVLGAVGTGPNRNPTLLGPGDIF